MLRIVVTFFVLVAVCACDPTPDQVWISEPPSAGQHLHEVLRFSVKGQQCEWEKTEYLEENKTAFISSVDELIKATNPGLPDPKVVNQGIEWIRQNQKNITSLGDDLATVLRNHAEDFNNSLIHFFGESSPSQLTEESVWNFFQLAQQEEWKTLEPLVQQVYTSLKAPTPELIEVREIFARLSTLAMSEEGQGIYKELFTEGAPKSPSGLQLWDTLQFAQRPELLQLAKSFHQEFADFSNPTSPNAEFLVLLERMQRLARTEDGDFLYQTLKTNLNATQFDEDDLTRVLAIAQREDVIKLAKRFSDAIIELKNPTKESTLVWQKLIQSVYDQAANLELSALSEQQVWEFVRFSQRDDVADLANRVRAGMAELGESEVLRRDLDVVKEVLLSSKAGFVRKTFARDVPDGEKAWELVRFGRVLAPELSEPQVLATLNRLFKFAFTDDGRKVLAYAKRFITEPETREFMIALFDFAKGYHGSIFQGTGLNLCLGKENFSVLGNPGRKLCVAAMWAAGLDSTLSREALDFGAIAFQNNVIQDLLSVLKIITDIYANYPTHVPKSFSVNTDDIRQFFANPRHVKAAQYAFEMIFEKDGMGESLSRLAGIGTYYALSKYEAEIAQLTTLAKSFNLTLQTLTKARLAQMLTIAKIDGLFDALPLLLDHVSDFNLIGALAKELNLSPKDVTPEQVSLFVSFVNDGNHRKAARILYALVGQKEFRDDAFRIGDFIVGFASRHENDLKLAQSLDKDYGLFKRFVEFASVEKNQMVAKHLYDLAAKNSIANDLMRLNALANRLLVTKALEFEALDRLRTHLGLSFERIVGNNSSDFIRYVDDEKNQKAALELFRFTLQLSRLGAKSAKYMPFPELSHTRPPSQTEIASGFRLAKMGFELWSMTNENGCTSSFAKNLKEQGFDKRILHFADFLVSTKGGFRSWLKLFAKVAEDNE